MKNMSQNDIIHAIRAGKADGALAVVVREAEARMTATGERPHLRQVAEDEADTDRRIAEQRRMSAERVGLRVNHA